MGWIERGRELVTQYGTKVESAFTPNHPTHPRGAVHLAVTALAWQDARNFARLVADRQLAVSS